MIASPVYCPRLVGRIKQLDFLAERSLAAAQGCGSLVFIEGDAGSGKTRLVSEFCKTLDPQDMRHVGGTCFEYAKVPFGPIMAALRALFKDDPKLVPEATTSRVILSRLIPELSETPPTNPTLDASEKLHYFEVLVQVLRSAAEKRPTILVIEDLHWADEATNEFLEYALRSLSTMPLCIVATYRSDEPVTRRSLQSLVVKLERNPASWRLELTALSDDDMQTFITEAVGDRATITPEMALAIRAKAEGHPLFAEELLRNALTSGKRMGARDLPRSLREAVVQRLSRLSDVDRSIVVSASAIGRRYTPELLAHITGVQFEAIVAALKRAIELQLIVEDGDDGEMIFRHALTREATYAELLAAEARPLHAKIAQAIENMTSSPGQVAELAYQWWSAGNKPKAAIYNERAGDEAEAVYASQDAALFFERALEALDASDIRRAALLRKQAGALFRSGLGARARAAYESAVATFLQTGDVHEAAPTLIELARLHWTLGNAADHLDATQRALDLAGEHQESPVWFAARVESAWSQSMRGGDADEALRLLTEAQNSHPKHPVSDLVKFYECRALVQILRAAPNEALADAEKASSIALETKDVARAVRCWGNVGALAAQCGEQSMSTQAFSHALDLIERECPKGWPTPWALALHAYEQFLHGELANAEAIIERALSAILDVPSLDVILACIAIPVGLRRQNSALVERCANADLIEFAFRSGSSLVGGVAHAFAEYYLANGNTSDAKALLTRALDTLHSPPTPGDYDATLVMIAQYCDREHVERARSLLQEMAKKTRVRSVPAQLALVSAWEAKRFGNAHAAIELASEAAQCFEALGWPLHQAQALEISGRFADAAHLYRTAGNVADLGRLEDLVAPPNRRGRRKDELSAREKEIADLVIAGKSNREIATDLVLSERTVESHISSILGKLELSSRLELADRLKASKTATAKGSPRV